MSFEFHSLMIFTRWSNRTIGAEPLGLQNHDIPGDLFGLSKVWPNIVHLGRRDRAFLCDKVFMEHNDKNYCDEITRLLQRIISTTNALLGNSRIPMIKIKN